MAKKKPLSQQEQLLQNFYNSQESTGSQSEDLLRDVKFMNDKNSFTGSYGVYAGVQDFNESFNKDRFKEAEGETTTEITPEITPGNSLFDSETTLTPETRNSNANPPEVSIRKKYDLMSPTMIGGLGESAPEINIPTADEMKASGKKSSEKRMKLYDDSINTSKSRNRMGLFGNYGKDVTIKKTSNEVTGKVNREKFVDGKLVKSRFNNQEFKASKSKGNKNARQNRKNR